jgi:hypothetical protein
LNLGIENLNEMQEAAQETILNDNNVLLLSHLQVQGKPHFFIANIRNVNLKFFGSMFNSGSSRELGLQIEQV